MEQKLNSLKIINNYPIGNFNSPMSKMHIQYQKVQTGSENLQAN